MKIKRREFTLVRLINDEPRANSRLIAQKLGIEHKNLIAIIEKYLDDFKEFGPLAFQTRVPKEPTGNPPKDYLLNEDQCYFALTLVRNTIQAVELKKALVHQFSKLRQRQSFQQAFMPRGYPQMLEAARNDWKQVRNELINLLSTHLHVYDRKRKSQFTNQIYLDLIETTARRLRDHFLLTRPNQLTRDYLHQLVQESIVEIEIRLSDALMSGSITTWEEFKNELERIADHIRYMKELQNGRIPLPQYAYPIVNNMQTH
jgi:phage regulator Rha-like protein